MSRLRAWLARAIVRRISHALDNNYRYRNRPEAYEDWRLRVLLPLAIKLDRAAAALQMAEESWWA